MKPKVHYTNLWSRLFARSLFDTQWVLPLHERNNLTRFLEWYERHAMTLRLDGVRVDRPIFIISLPRSGSSMLQDLLCAHPDMAYITNMMYFFPSCFCAAESLRKRLRINIKGERFLQDSVEVEGGSPSDPVGLWAAWLKQDPYSLEYADCRLTDFAPADIERIRTDIRRILWCFEGRATRFECKTPALLPHLQLLAELFPDGKFIHLVRDARMNANSMLKLHRLCNEQLDRIRSSHGLGPAEQAFVPYPRLPRLAEYIREYGADDIRTTAHLWDDAARFIADRRGGVPHFHEVRYEDIVSSPRAKLLELFEFCELPPPPPSHLPFWDKLAKVGAVHHTNAYSNFDIVESICQDTLKQYGYR